MLEVETVVVHGSTQLVGCCLFSIEIGVSRGEQIQYVACSPPASLAIFGLAESLSNHLLK